jgi:hypothetical protein
LSRTFQDDHADLSFDIVGMDGKHLTGFKIKIEDFKIGGVVNQQAFKGKISEIVGLI